MRRESNQALKRSVSPSYSHISQHGAAGGKQLINFAEYISTVQRENRKKKQANRRKKQESAKKNEKEIFELEEECEKEKFVEPELEQKSQRSKSQHQHDPFFDKNVKFDYSDRSAKFLDGSKHHSCYDISECEASQLQKSTSALLKYEPKKDASFNGLSFSQNLVSPSAHHVRSCSQRASYLKESDKDEPKSSVIDSFIARKESSNSSKRLPSGRGTNRDELDVCAALTLEQKSSSGKFEAHSPARSFNKSQALVKINVEPNDQKGQSLSRSIKFENKNVFDRFMELDICEQQSDEKCRYKGNTSAAKLGATFTEREGEVFRPQFRPLLTKKSLEIASKLGDPVDRLVRFAGAKKRQIEDDARTKMFSDCTFTPKINRKSRYLDEKNMILRDNTGLSVSRHDKLYLKVLSADKKLDGKKHLIDRKKEEEEEKLLQEKLECTFRPKKLNNYNGNQIMNQVSVEERAMIWAKRIEEKLDGIRKEKDKEIETICTFTPKIVVAADPEWPTC